MSRISVVIPVYNGAGTLEELARRLRETLAECCDGFELVFVDDASSDESWEILKRLREADREHVKLLQHARNFGQHKAILTGLAHASGDLVVTMDDDLQHPPEEIATLLRAIGERDHWDVVFGAYTVKRHAGWRNLGSVVVNRITQRVFGIPPELQLTSFRIMRRWVADELIAMTTQTPRLNHMIAALTLRLGNVPVRHEPGGRSRYTTRRLLSNALDTILGHTALPLQLVSGLGFATSLVSFALGVYYLGKYFVSGVQVPGWTTIVVLMLFLFGILFFSLGIVGEYLIRILRQLQTTPRTIVREEHGTNGEGS